MFLSISRAAATAGMGLTNDNEEPKEAEGIMYRWINVRVRSSKHGHYKYQNRYLRAMITE